MIGFLAKQSGSFFYFLQIFMFVLLNWLFLVFLMKSVSDICFFVDMGFAGLPLIMPRAEQLL